MSTTIITILAFAIAIILFRALKRQTLRADRAEAALERIEATIAECQRDVTVKLLLDRLRAHAGKVEDAR